MAKKPKFLKNLLTTASALTLVATSGSALGADLNYAITGNAATNANANQSTAGGVIAGGADADARIIAGDTVSFFFTVDANLDVQGTGPYKSIEFLNYGGNILVGNNVGGTTILSITNTPGTGGAGSPAAVAVGAPVGDGVAAANARILKFTGANDTTVGIMTGIGAVDFATKDQTLSITGAQTVTATFTGKGAGGGAGNAGTIYAKEAITFSGAFDNVNKVKNFKVLDGKKVTLNTNLNLAEDLAIGSAAAGGTVEVEDTKNINVREIKGSAVGKGKLVFKGASVVDATIGTNNALELIEINAGEVEFKGTIANAHIKATNIKFSHKNAIMKISTRAAEVTGDITANAAGDGKILMNGQNLDVKGGIGHDKAIGVLEFDADNTLKLLPGTANAGTYKINKVNTAANAAGSGTIIFGSNAAQSFTGEIGADNALKEVVIHSNDGAGNAATTFDLTKGSKITAKNIRLAGAGVDNKLYLQDGAQITGAVSSGATAVPAVAAANRGQIYVKGNATITGNIGRDSADAVATIDKIVFDTAGKTLTVSGAKIETSSKNLLEFTAVDAILKLTNDTNMALQSANAANALVVTNGTLGTISSAIKTNNTLTLTGAIGDNKNKLKLLEAKAGGAVKLTGGNAYIQAIDLGDGDGTLELNGNTNTYNFTLSNTDEKSILSVTNDATLDEAVFSNTLKQVNVFNNKTLKLNKVASLKVKDKFTGTGSLVVSGGGATTITGNIGSADAAGNKYKDLTVEGDNTVLAIDGNGYFSGNVTLNDKTTLKLGGANGTEFKLTTNGAGINGKAPNNGTLVFNNDKDFTFTGNTTNLASIQISGTNVFIVGAPGTQKIEFTDKTKAATLTLDGDIGGAVVTTTATADNRIHNLAVKGNQEFKSTGAIGTKDNIFGNIRQLTQDIEGKDPVVIKISTKNFFAGIEVAKDNHNAIIFNVDGAIAYSIGESDKRAKSIQFVENGTVKGDAYAKVINVDVEKTATFEKIVSSTDGIVLGSTKGVDAAPNVPAVPAKGATVVFEDGSTVLSKVKTTLDEVGTATFKGSATVKAQLGESANWLNTVAFEDAAITKDKAYAIEGADIYASTIEFNKTPVNFKTNNITLYGAIDADGSTFNIGTNNVKVRGGETSEFKGNIVWNIEYKDGNIGSIEAIDDKTIIDFTKADSVKFVITADANANISGDQTRTIFKINDGTVIKGNFTAEGNYSLPETNKYIKWTVTDANKGILTLVDVYTTVKGQELKSDKNATVEAKANYDAFANAKAGDAALYHNEVLRKLDDKDFTESINRISHNPDQTILYGVRSITERAVNAPLVARLFTLSSPIAAQSASLETGVAAGTELDQSKARYGLWVTPFYSKTIQKIFDGASGFEGDTFGGTLGFDAMANDTMIVGIAATFASTKLKHKDINVGDKTDAKSYYVTIYGVQVLPFGDVFLEGMATLGTSTIENKAIRIGAAPGAPGAPTQEIALGKYDSMSIGGEFAVGTNQQVDMAVLTPVLGLSYNKYMDEPFTETGTKYQNLTVMKKSTNKIDVFVGFRATMATESGDMIITPDLSAFIRQTLNKGESKVNIRLDGQASPLAALTVKPIKTLFQVGAGVTVQSGMIDTSIRYDGAFSSKPNRFEHQGSLKLRLNF